LAAICAVWGLFRGYWNAVSLLFPCWFVAVGLLPSEGNQQADSKETATTQQQIGILPDYCQKTGQDVVQLWCLK